tara:strand:- start:626 stop:772 length:147 start_codon:yes stop_codon:yes gene_type:complete
MAMHSRNGPGVFAKCQDKSNTGLPAGAVIFSIRRNDGTQLPVILVPNR